MSRGKRPPWRPVEYRNAVRDSDLPGPARAIALTLRDEFYREGRGKVSHSRLAEWTGYSAPTVDRHLGTLADEGWITRKAPSKAGALGHGAMTHYRLHVPHGDGHDRGNVQATNVPHSEGGDVPQSEGASPSQRGTLPRKEVGRTPERPAPSAGAPDTDRPPPRLVVAGVGTGLADATPWDVEIDPHPVDEGHHEVSVETHLDLDDDACGWPEADREKGREHLRALARHLAPILTDIGQEARRRHGFIDGGPAVLGSACGASTSWIDEDWPFVSVTVTSAETEATIDAVARHTLSWLAAQPTVAEELPA